MNIETIGNTIILIELIIFFAFCAYKYISQNKKYSEK